MDKALKKKLGILSFIPLLAYTICTIYFIYINKSLIHAKEFDDHLAVNGITANHYTTLTWLISIATLIAGVLYFYYIIHILRLVHMSSWSKIGWLVFLTAFGAFGCPYFHYRQLRTEPKDVALKDLDQVDG